ncbi:hypothetical protein TNCV_119211 [Trichonephila clavipes]|nr:hypothetical protein TNCV_119211 [Trichonephila clavipes]
MYLIQTIILIKHNYLEYYYNEINTVRRVKTLPRNCILGTASFLRLLAAPEHENDIQRIPFSEWRGDNIECYAGVELNSKGSLLLMFSAVEGM